jgi:hypothetical protein
MKNGKEFAEKMFSEMEEDNYEVQEKLYSTGNDELDDLLERAFCEGYEYAQKEFGRAERKERRESNRKMRELGISRSDRDDITIKKEQYKKNPEKFKNIEDLSSDDPETRRKANKENTKRLAKILVPVEAATGAALGAGLGSSQERITKSGKVKTKAGKGALIGTAAGAAFGAGLSALNHAEYKRRSKKAEKYPEGLHDQARQKDRDASKVAKGEMSEEEFAKKYATRRIKRG